MKLRKIALCFFGLVALGCTQPVSAKSVDSAALHFPLVFDQNRGQSPVEYAFVFHRDGVQGRFFSKGADLRIPGKIAALTGFDWSSSGATM